MKIIDNFFDKDLLDCINDQIKNMKFIPHGSGKTKEVLSFFYSEGILNERFWQVIFDKILEKTNIDEKECGRAYVNCYPYNTNTDWHIDNYDGGCEKTIIFYPTEWKKEYKGATIFKNNKIEYVENRLLIFDSSLEHATEKHKRKNMRYTLVYKVRKRR